MEYKNKKYTTQKTPKKGCEGCAFEKGDHSECAEVAKLTGQYCGFEHIIYIEEA